MDTNITKEQVELFKCIAQIAEPFSEDELKKNDIYDDHDMVRIKRYDATMARIILKEHGIQL